MRFLNRSRKGNRPEVDTEPEEPNDDGSPPKLIDPKRARTQVAFSLEHMDKLAVEIVEGLDEGLKMEDDTAYRFWRSQGGRKIGGSDFIEGSRVFTEADLADMYHSYEELSFHVNELLISGPGTVFHYATLSDLLYKKTPASVEGLSKYGDLYKEAQKELASLVPWWKRLIPNRGLTYQEMGPNLRGVVHLSIVEHNKTILAAKMRQKTTVFRGVEPTMGVHLQDLKVGDTFSPPGFTDTTTFPSIAKQYTRDFFGEKCCLMRIHLPKGSKARSVVLGAEACITLPMMSEFKTLAPLRFDKTLGKQVIDFEYIGPAKGSPKTPDELVKLLESPNRKMTPIKSSWGAILVRFVWNLLLPLMVFAIFFLAFYFTFKAITSDIRLQQQASQGLIRGLGTTTTTKIQDATGFPKNLVYVLYAVGLVSILLLAWTLYKRKMAMRATGTMGSMHVLAIQKNPTTTKRRRR